MNRETSTGREPDARLEAALESLRQRLGQWGVEVAPDWVPRLGELYRALEEVNRQVNLTRIVTPEAFVTKHIEDSLLAVRVAPQLAATGCRVVDVGCGGGFPGLPLALTFPGLRVLEVDATRKKTDAVRAMVDRMRTPNVEVACGRARELARQVAHSGTYDAVVARAVGPTSKLIRECRGFLRAGGACLLAYKTPGQVEEEASQVERDAARARLRAETSPVFELCGGEGERQFWILRT